MAANIKEIVHDSDVTAPVKVDLKLVIIAGLSLCISTRLVFPRQCGSALQ